MRRSTWILLAVALPAADLRAQLETVTPGSRVRVSVRTPAEEHVRGELTARIRDTVTMVGGTEKRFGRTNRAIPRSFAVSGLERFEVSVGRSPLTGALRGGALGLAVASGYGALVFVFSKLNGGGGTYFRQQTKIDPLQQFLGATAGLVPIGALIGALNAPDKWRRVYPAR